MEVYGLLQLPQSALMLFSTCLKKYKGHFERVAVDGLRLSTVLLQVVCVGAQAKWEETDSQK